MSVDSLRPLIKNIRADGHITTAEAKQLVKPENGIGTVFDRDEFQVISKVATDIKAGEMLKTPNAGNLKALNSLNKERLVHKGVVIGGLTGGAAALAISIAAGSLGFFFFGGAPLAAVAVGVGALAGLIRSKRAPVTEEDVVGKTEKAVAAATFKKDKDVKSGVRFAGLTGAVMTGIVAVGGSLNVIGAALAGGVGAGLFMGAAGTAFVAPPVGAVICVMIGVGALTGFIASKLRSSRNKSDEIPSGPITADPEAQKIIQGVVDKGITSKQRVRKGAKAGGIVGGTISGVAIAGTGIAAVASGGLTGTYALNALGLLGIGMGMYGLAFTGVCMGIGALVGYIRSKANPEPN